MIVVLTGGSGGAKFVQGLQQVVPADELTFIVNTGDDLIWWGLHVSPDLDSITYALAGMLSTERGWGVEGDTFQCLEDMKKLGAPAWFQLGDRDLATHLRRTELLASGKSLTEATAEIAGNLGVGSNLLPMTDDRVETRVQTAIGDLSFQEYFVRERYQVAVESVRFVGAEQARPASGVLAAIENAEAVLIAPSNPITSIGPILAIAGIREALIRTSARVLAVSPIVGAAAVSGPAGSLMQAQGLPVSAAGVARCYGDFLDGLIFDTSDAGALEQINGMGLEARCTNTIMKTLEDKVALARFAIEHSRAEAHSAYAKA
jgi:LPPG:FO 2-phospho-L-lactate transferase